jgi:hypothetical protein
LDFFACGLKLILFLTVADRLFSIEHCVQHLYDKRLLVFIRGICLLADLEVFFKLVLFFENQLLKSSFLQHLFQHPQVLLVLFGLDAVEANASLGLGPLLLLPGFGLVHAKKL